MFLGEKIMDPFILVLVIIGVGLVAIWYFNRGTKDFDTNNDGLVNFDDAKKAVENTVAGVKAAADVNKDGKVDGADVKAVATKAKKPPQGVETPLRPPNPPRAPFLSHTP